MIRKLALYLALATTLTVNGPAFAQTALGNSGNRLPVKPNQMQSANNQSSQMPVSKKVIKQAKQQVEGNFSMMNRSSVGGQIQPVWNESEKTEGFFQYNECADCIYKVRIREFMVTTLILPKGTEVHSFDVGDPAQFQVSQRADNMLAVQAAGGGVDTNLIVYTKAGKVFPFYLRAENFNSMNVPDMVVKVNGSHLPDAPILRNASITNEAEAIKAKIETLLAEVQEADKPIYRTNEVGGVGEVGGKQGAALAGLQKKAGKTSEEELRAKGKDFVENVGFDPDKLRGYDEYELWGSDELKPEMVFRDDHFTYIKFGDKWNDLDLPTAYVVVDDIDELVNTRVQGTTFIIESTKRLISLKSGKSFLCIQYEGEV